MGKIKDFFLPCAKKLDLAIQENMRAAQRVKQSMTMAPHIVLEAIKHLSHDDFEVAANGIRENTGTERREHARSKPKKNLYPPTSPTIHRDIWSFTRG